MIKCKQSNSCTVGMKQYQFYFSVVISILDWLDVVAIIIIQNVASDQILQDLPLLQQFVGISTSSKINLFKRCPNCEYLG